MYLTNITVDFHAKWSRILKIITKTELKKCSKMDFRPENSFLNVLIKKYLWYFCFKMSYIISLNSTVNFKSLR